MKDIRISELTSHLKQIEDEIQSAISPIISKIEVPYNIEVSLDIDLLDVTEMTAGQRRYLVGEVKLRPTFL